MKPKKEKGGTPERPGDPREEAKMASLQEESSLIQSDRVLTPGPGLETLDNSLPASEEWNDAYEDFFRRT